MGPNTQVKPCCEATSALNALLGGNFNGGFMEYKVQVMKPGEVYVEASSEAEAIEKALQRHDVASASKAEAWPPGMPCPDCNPSGVFRFSPAGESCQCKGNGFV